MQDWLDVRIYSPLTAAERDELAAWIRTRASPQIIYVTIEDDTVTIRGHTETGRVASVTAIRHPAQLAGALDEALSTLRNTPYQHRSGQPEPRFGVSFGHDSGTIKAPIPPVPELSPAGSPRP